MTFQTRVALWTMLWTVQDFNDESDVSMWSDVTSQTSYVQLVEKLADKIWSFRRHEHRISPILCDYVRKEELMAYLSGFGPDDDGRPINCAKEGCGVLLPRFFTLLWDNEHRMPFDVTPMCKSCAVSVIQANLTQTRGGTLQVVECKIFRWRDSPGNPDSIPAYIEMFLRKHMESVIVSCVRHPDLGIPACLATPDFFRDMDDHYSTVIKGLCRKRSLRQHILFVYCAVAHISSPRYLHLCCFILLWFHAKFSAAREPSDTDWQSRIASVKAAYPDLQGVLSQITGEWGSVRNEMPADCSLLVETEICKRLFYFPAVQVRKFFLDNERPLLPYLRFLVGHWLGIEKAAELSFSNNV